jgi:Ala-tRNA(Pro) deacylase
MHQDLPVFERLCALLTDAGARYRVIEHPAAGRSEEVAAIRGTDPRQGAKAMLCTFKTRPQLFVLTVLPGDRKLDFRKVGAALGLGKATLASADDAMRLTGCVVGAIPPFVFSGEIALLVEPALVETWGEIAFNAGRLDRSIVLDSADYVRVARPQLVAMAQDAAGA